MWRPHSDCSDCNSDRTNPCKQRCERRANYVGSALVMAGAGGDPTTTVATAPTRITLVVTIGVIITTTATTTINDDDGSGAYELRYRLTDKCSYRPHGRHCEASAGCPLCPRKRTWERRYLFGIDRLVCSLSRRSALSHISQDAAGRPLIVRKINSHHRLVKSVGDKSM